MGPLRWEWAAPASASTSHRSSHGHIGLWNVRGLSASDTKLPLLVDEMVLRKMDLLFITETWWLHQGTLPLPQGYLLLHSGGTETPRRGVGIIMSPRVATAWQQSGALWIPISDRIIMARIPCGPGHRRGDKTFFSYLSIIVAYSPTEPIKGNQEQSAAADHFYSSLHDVCLQVPKEDHILLAGDFNARVGTFNPDTSTVLGRFGLSPTNSNGHRLIDLAMAHNLAITGSFFKHKTIHKITWRNPVHQPKWRRKDNPVPSHACLRPGHVGHMIDHFLISRTLLVTGAVRDVRSYNGTSVDKIRQHKAMDHALVLLTLAASSRPTQRSRPAHAISRPGLITDPLKLQDPVCQQAYTNLRLQHKHQHQPNIHSPDQVYTPYRDQLVQDFKTTFGVPRPRDKIWVSEETKHALDRKKCLLRTLTRHSSAQVERDFKSQRRLAKKLIRRDKRHFISSISNRLNDPQAQPNMREIFRTLDLLTGKRGTPIHDQPIKGPDGSFITGDLQSRCNAFASHFQTQLNVSTSTTPAMVEQAVLPESLQPPHPDPQPFSLHLSKEEILQAISDLHCRRAADAAGVLPEMLKMGQWDVQTDLTALLNDMIDTGDIPTAWTEAMILPLFKGKGDPAIPANYRAIVITDIISKVFTRAIYNQLVKELNDKILPTQAGFRKTRSTSEHVFVLRQLMESAREYKQPLYVAFVDIEKAYDGIPRKPLLKVLRRYGASSRLCHLIDLLYRKTSARVRLAGVESDLFDICTGVKQGCILSTILFNIYLDFAIRQVIPRFQHKGVSWRVSKPLDPRTRASTSRSSQTSQTSWYSILVNHLLYADDTTIIASSCQELRQMLTDLNAEFQKWGLKLSSTKTVIGCLNCDQLPSTPIYLNGQSVPQIPNGKAHTFKFLGSLLDFRNPDSTTDMWHRVNLAQSVVRRLSKSVWHLPGLSIRAKVNTFTTLVLPVLLHGCETWTLSDANIQQLEGFVGRSLRTLLGLSWQHKVSYETIRHRCFMCTQGPIAWHIRYSQLRWFGHLMRMKDDSLPLQVMCGAPPDLHRPARKPPLRWIDRIYSYLTQLEVPTRDPTILRNLALQRQTWRDTIRKPMHCHHCTAITQVRDIINGIIDGIGSPQHATTVPQPVITPSRARPNREAPWRGNQPWFSCTTHAGPQYGVSTSGRPKKRPRLDPDFDYDSASTSSSSLPTRKRKRSTTLRNGSTTQAIKKKRRL